MKRTANRIIKSSADRIMKSSGSRILVTGASGCLGANLVEALVRRGDKVRIFILEKTWHPFLDNLNVEIIYGDITKKEDVLKAMSNCSFVYHVAGIVSYHKKDDELVYKVNCLGTRNVLETAKELGVKKVVVTASTAGVGIPKDKEPLNEESSFDIKKYQRIMYMYSKNICIENCKRFAKDGLNVSIVSPTTIIGQGDIAMHMGSVIKKIKEGRLRMAPPGGNSFISVDDIVDAHILVMEKGKIGENYIFADEGMSYLEIFNAIAEATNARKVKNNIPKAVLPLANRLLNLLEKIMMLFNKKTPLPAAALMFSFKYRYFDSSKARKELNWLPKVPFKEALNKAISFYEKQGML